MATREPNASPADHDELTRGSRRRARLDFDSVGEGRPVTPGRPRDQQIWGYAIKLVQDAYQAGDVYLVARMKGAGIIDRERPGDQAF